MKKIILIISFLVLSLFSCYTPKIKAADNANDGFSADSPITDWYIKDFKSDITLNKDSSLTITEDITADCGDLPDKHGIFRTLPLEYAMDHSSIVSTPIKLISITDFNDNPLHYSESYNNSSDIRTVTWKIGDPNITVHGENYYRIKYTVKNTVRFGNENFDELYWNLSGNFWQININHFKATIHFPEEITKDNSKIYLYNGGYGNDYGLDTWKTDTLWTSKNKIEVNSLIMIKPYEGITISITFPKNIETPYTPTFWEKYGYLLPLILPLLALIIGYLIWNKYGRDPKINSAIAPEFEIPEKLTPLLMGLLDTNGSMKSSYITSQIIYLATLKVLKIEQTQTKSLLHEADYNLILQIDTTKGQKPENILLLNKIFSQIKKGETVKLSSFKNNFYKELSDIGKKCTAQLIEAKYLTPKGNQVRNLMIGVPIVLIFLNFLVIANASSMDSKMLFILIPSLIITVIIFAIFGFLMPKRTQEGAFLEHRIKGFRMYMETAEKYRSQFNEKENIFEKFLPYAILFGMTKKWIKAMKNIYGESYFATYHPIWFYGSVANFNVDDFASNIEHLSSQISTTMSSSPSSSGAGGGGFAGGGGGGGGGGGW